MFYMNSNTAFYNGRIETHVSWLQSFKQENAMQQQDTHDRDSAPYHA